MKNSKQNYKISKGFTFQRSCLGEELILKCVSVGFLFFPFPTPMSQVYLKRSQINRLPSNILLDSNQIEKPWFLTKYWRRRYFVLLSILQMVQVALGFPTQWISRIKIPSIRNITELVIQIHKMQWRPWTSKLVWMINLPSSMNRLTGISSHL